MRSLSIFTLVSLFMLACGPADVGSPADTAGPMPHDSGYSLPGGTQPVVGCQPGLVLKVLPDGKLVFVDGTALCAGMGVDKGDPPPEISKREWLVDPAPDGVKLQNDVKER